MKRTQVRIHHYVTHHQNCRSVEIAKALGLSPATIKENIRELVQDGVIDKKEIRVDGMVHEFTTATPYTGTAEDAWRGVIPPTLSQKLLSRLWRPGHLNLSVEGEASC